MFRVFLLTSAVMASTCLFGTSVLANDQKNQESFWTWTWDRAESPRRLVPIRQREIAWDMRKESQETGRPASYLQRIREGRERRPLEFTPLLDFRIWVGNAHNNMDRMSRREVRRRQR
jgi:hypothetical protein